MSNLLLEKGGGEAVRVQVIAKVSSSVSKQGDFSRSVGSRFFLSSWGGEGDSRRDNDYGKNDDFYYEKEPFSLEG